MSSRWWLRRSGVPILVVCLVAAGWAAIAVLPAAAAAAVAAAQPTIASGQEHTCALLPNGTVECWGYNGDGELGNGTTNDSATPVAVSGLTGAIAIATGWSQSCALLTNRTVKCWGDNAWGQLGDGTTVNSPTPVAVSGLTGAVGVSAGFTHTCAVLADGTAECWGYNTSGELGDGSETQALTPVAVSGLSGAVQIAAGYYDSCALLTGGTAECWGYNGEGALGTGTTVSSPTPVAVSGLTGAVSITAGYDHSCALRANRTAECWGDNSDGELGNGSTAQSLTPIAVSGVTTATAISADEDHACVVLANGTARCWGANSEGSLGNGTSVSSPTPVAVKGLTGATGISVGFDHACVSLTSGVVECWGYNGEGQLGNGATNDTSTVPVKVRSRVSASCTIAQTCRGTVVLPAASGALAQMVVVTGNPSAANGNVGFGFEPATLACPTIKSAVAQVGTLLDTGFSAATRLTVSTTLRDAKVASSYQVCFNSKTPFKSQTSPTTKKAGTAALLRCTKVANVAPCVVSSKQVGANVLVTFVAPGGDPRFRIAAAVARAATGTVGKAFTLQLTPSGTFVKPIAWKLASGRLPAGLKLGAGTGLIAGKPTRKGTFKFSVNATDHSKPPKSQTLAVTIVVN